MDFILTDSQVCLFDTFRAWLQQEGLGFCASENFQLLVVGMGPEAGGNGSTIEVEQSAGEAAWRWLHREQRSLWMFWLALLLAQSLLLCYLSKQLCLAPSKSSATTPDQYQSGEGQRS